jgi:hypothetical protein
MTVDLNGRAKHALSFSLGAICSLSYFLFDASTLIYDPRG